MYEQILTVKEMQDHAKWLDIRNQGIGGSDAGVILGYNSYKSPIELYREKIEKTTVDLSDNEYVYWGNILENEVAKEFSKRSGLKVRRMGTVRSKEYPFMIANIDRWIIGKSCGLECKTTNSFFGKNWEDDEIPDSYYCQCLHYMAVTGAPCWYIAVLIGGNKFIYKKIERNEEDIKALIAAEKEFWEKVETKTLPEIDESKACENALKVIFKGNEGSETQLPNEALELIKDIDEDSEILNKLKDNIQLKKNKLMLMMGDYETGIIGNRKITWKLQKARESISLSKIKKEDKKTYEELKEKGYITIGERTRRFRIY